MIDYTLPLDELPDPLPIEPLTKPFDVTITPPGSKSITCRAYVLAALAEGESKIIRPLRADDTDKLLDALCTLGVEARWEGEDVYIKGVAGRFPRGGEVNLGDGGTPARFMIACACLAAEPVVVDGSPRMRERPIAEGVDMLRQLGATIEYVEEEGRLPVRVVPSENFKGGELEIGKTQSSQSISAVLLISPCLKKRSALSDWNLELRIKSEPTSPRYIELTLNILMEFGAEGLGGEIYPGNVSMKRKKFRARTFTIEPDASSAIYPCTAASLVPKSTIHVEGLFFLGPQPDLEAIHCLDAEKIDFNFKHLTDVRLCGKESRSSFNMDASVCPDGALALAVFASMANTVPSKKNRSSDGLAQPDSLQSTISGLHTLHVKETDRLTALKIELTKLGCKVETTDDSITIDPPHRRDACATEEEPVTIETYNDHRMAMAFAVLGLARPGISISNPKCVAKSYPGFWKDFARLYA